RAGPSLAAAQHVEARVGGDAVQPGSQRGTSLEAVDAAPRPHERLLHGVLGLEARAEHAVAVPGQLLAVLLQLAEHGIRGRDVRSDGHGVESYECRHTGTTTSRG